MLLHITFKEGTPMVGMKEQVEQIMMTDRLIAKSGIAVKARMAEYIMDGAPALNSLSDEELLGILNESIKERKWVDLSVVASVLWHRDWSHHLGRNFLVEGSDPDGALGF
jgi:hypothetical protein